MRTCGLFVILGLWLLNYNINVCAQESKGNDIVIISELPPIDPLGGRSLDVSPTAFIEGQYITVNYPLSTISQVIIRDADTGAVVYSASYDATRQVVINLSSLPEGTYEICLYAFGKWWWGEFTIEIN